MRDRVGVILGLVLGGVLGISGSAPVAGGDEFFTVGVVGLVTAERGDYELQIGPRAWAIDRGGYQLVETAQPITVTLWRLDGCEVVLRFQGAPGGGRARNTIDLGSGTGRVRFERGGSDAVATRPIATRSHAPSCALPDTSTATSTHVGTDILQPEAILALTSLAGLPVVRVAMLWGRMVP